MFCRLHNNLYLCAIIHIKMKTMNRWMLTALFLLCGLLAVQAQIPAEVSEMMRKCEANMNHASGCEYDMNVHMSMMVMSIDMKMVIAQKNGKSLVRTSMSKMGREMTTENGFDGHQSWSFKHVKLTDKDKKKGKEYKDTLTITKGAKAEKDDEFELEFDFDKSYRKATVKQSGRYKVITFSNPVDKDDPKKVTVKVDTEKMLLREVSMKESIAKITMTVTRVKYGVSDNFFVLDTSKFPGAVIVRK